MSIIQLEELVSYQLRTSYLNELADGVGERLLTINEAFLNSAPFRAAGWRPNPSYIKRTHSPPIPTAIAAEYFQAPRFAGLTLEDGPDNRGRAGRRDFTIGGVGGRNDGLGPAAAVVAAAAGPAAATAPAPAPATKRRRRREQMEDDDSSDPSDDSDDESEQQRAAQQIRFAKMPIRNRAGSSPIQTSGMRQPSSASTVTAKSPRSNGAAVAAATAATAAAAPAPSQGGTARRGSHSALETVKETARRDTITSSEVSSDNEPDVVAAGAGTGGGAGAAGTVTGAAAAARSKPRDAIRAAARAAKLQAKLNGQSAPGGIGGARPGGGDTALLEEDDSDPSDGSEGYVESVDSASILNVVEDNPDLVVPATPTQQVVGTPPRNFTRRSTIRRSQLPPPSRFLSALPPPRPMSTIRPLSVAQPTSLLSAALRAKKHKVAIPFQAFASLNGAGAPRPITVRIYAPFSETPHRPFEVLIRPTVSEAGLGPGQGKERHVMVTDLIGLSLFRYNEDKYAPGLPADRLNVNWWALRMVEEGGDVDDDFPPLERVRPLNSFTVNPANSSQGRPAGRQRSNSSKAHDEFALVMASAAEFADNERLTPQPEEEKEPTGDEPAPRVSSSGSGSAAQLRKRPPPPQQPPPPPPQLPSPLALAREPRLNPILNTVYRPSTFAYADVPPAPQATEKQQQQQRGQQQKKLLRIHIMSPDVPPGQLVTLDVATDTYLAEVLEQVCARRQLEKSTHVLKLPTSGAVVMLDRPVASIGAVSDLELFRRRFATDGSLVAGGGGAASPASSSPKLTLPPYATSADALAGGGGGGGGGSYYYGGGGGAKARRKAGTVHPLAQEVMRLDGMGVNGAVKRYTVWRKLTMRIVGASERMLAIDGEYVHILPASSGKPYLDISSGGKTTTVHFSNLLGCKITRRHPTNFKLVVYRAAENNKQYEFEAKNAEEAAEIVTELRRGIAPYREI